MEVEVGKTYQDSDDDVILVKGISDGGIDYVYMSSEEDVLGFMGNRTKEFMGLRPFEFPVVAVDLESHSGIVSDGLMYEFGYDNEHWDFSGHLIFISESDGFKGLGLDGQVDDFSFCRLKGTVPIEDELMSISEFQWFVKNKKSVVFRTSGNFNWRIHMDQAPGFIDKYEWTTINDETKGYGSPKKFLKKYLWSEET